MLTVEVTAEDIYAGEPGDPCGCAFALAFARRFPGSHPYANADGVAFEWRGQQIDLYLPDPVIAFIDAFDNGEPVEPATFELWPEEELTATAD